MNLLDILFAQQRSTSYRRAIQNTRNDAATDAEDAEYARIARALGNPDGFLFGTRGEKRSPVHLDPETALGSSLVIGASGSGKTRFILNLLLGAISRSLLGSVPALPIDLELVDPKQETFDLLAQHLAALWLESGAEARKRIVSAVRVIDWSADAVTPFAPFDNARGEVSDAYLAYLRTDVAIQAGAHSYSGALRQAFFMFARVLVEKRFPPNYRFAVRFLEDDAYRKRILSGIGDADVRAFFAEAKHTLPKQTRDALLRRIQSDMSFPEVRLAVGMPPAEIERLLPSRTPSVVLGNYGCSMTMPLEKGKERASYRLIDVLLAAPRRDARRRGLLVVEESPMLLAEENELAQALMEGARTLRSVGMGMLFAAQDFANALPARVVRTLQVNTRWWAVFQSREEAEWIYPHILPAARRGTSEAERHREFVHAVQNLRRQHFYLHVKGHRVLPLRAPDVPDPRGNGASGANELRAIFRREIASRSMVPAKTAAEAIAKWEAVVVDAAAVPPTPRPSGSKRDAAGIENLFRRLGLK
jgi:hypothetical protein